MVQGQIKDCHEMAVHLVMDLEQWVHGEVSFWAVLQGFRNCPKSSVYLRIDLELLTDFFPF